MSFLTQRFDHALVYAADLHRQQLRKVSSVPYVAHLLAVAAIVIEHGGDEDEAIAALLHDAIEDQGGQRVGLEIAERFGNRVYELVSECSDSDESPKRPWQERKTAHLTRMASASAGGKRIIAADKLHNARSLLADYRRLGETLWAHFRGGRQGTLWYLRASLEAIGSGAPPDLTAELARVLDQLEQLVSSA